MKNKNYDICKDIHIFQLLDKCRWALENGTPEYQHYRFQELVGYLNYQLNKQKYRDRGEKK